MGALTRMRRQLVKNAFNCKAEKKNPSLLFRYVNGVNEEKQFIRVAHGTSELVQFRTSTLAQPDAAWTLPPFGGPL